LQSLTCTLKLPKTMNSTQRRYCNSPCLPKPQCALRVLAGFLCMPVYNIGCTDMTQTCQLCCFQLLKLQTSQKSQNNKQFLASCSNQGPSKCLSMCSWSAAYLSASFAHAQLMQEHSSRLASQYSSSCIHALQLLCHILIGAGLSR